MQGWRFFVFLAARGAKKQTTIYNDVHRIDGYSDCPEPLVANSRRTDLRD
jgi:hypothetical protein